MRILYVSDATFYLYGKIMIGTIAGIVFINFIIFGIALLIAIIDFLKKCPICTFCICKKKFKELLIIDPDKVIDKDRDEIKKPTPPPTPPRDPTPEPTPDPTPESSPDPTPEITEEEKVPSYESEPEIFIPSA
jgi:hypothetical protein